MQDKSHAMTSTGLPAAVFTAKEAKRGGEKMLRLSVMKGNGRDACIWAEWVVR